MQIHDITREHKNKTSRQVGRGGGRGKTSGRGHKGQKARAGHKIRPDIRDDMKRRPKLRGRGSNRFLPKQEKPTVVNLTVIDEAYKSGETVSPQTLNEKNVIKLQRSKKPRVKILGTGEIKTKITVEGCEISSTAQEKIEKSGGSVA